MGLLSDTKLYDIDYEETFALVAKMIVICALIAVALVCQ
jgi:hypothetical protein